MLLAQVYPNTAGEEEERYVVVQALLPKAWKWSRRGCAKGSSGWNHMIERAPYNPPRRYEHEHLKAFKGRERLKTKLSVDT